MFLSYLSGRAQARCPGFDSRRLPAFSLFSICTWKTFNLYYDFFFSFLPLVCSIQKHIEVLLPALDSKLILVMSWEKTLLMNLSSNAGLGLGCRKSMHWFSHNERVKTTHVVLQWLLILKFYPIFSYTSYILKCITLFNRPEYGSLSAILVSRCNDYIPN